MDDLWDVTLCSIQGTLLDFCETTRLYIPEDSTLHCYVVCGLGICIMSERGVVSWQHVKHSRETVVGTSHS
jgi:hypothetical protein